jgi:hypothetical protein
MVLLSWQGTCQRQETPNHRQNEEAIRKKRAVEGVEILKYESEIVAFEGDALR